MRVSELPLPGLRSRVVNSINLITDDALAEHGGVRIAFTGRCGGVSTGKYSSLNLATHVGDDADAVRENRARVKDALQAADMKLVSANQVHGDRLVFIDRCDSAALDEAQHEADAGADGFIVSARNVVTLLCFADCIPVVIVSPSGSFALVHAGWRGVAASIAPKAVACLAKRESGQSESTGDPTENAVGASVDAAVNPASNTTDSATDNPPNSSETVIFDNENEAAASYNVYIGPYLRAECFEVGKEVYDRLVALGGDDCATDERHIDLGRVLINDLIRAGISVDRIADAGVCTKCNIDQYYSYRGSEKICGRHGALAFRLG